MPIKKVDGKYQYGTEGKAYKTYAKAARQAAAIKASQAATGAKRRKLACQAEGNAHPSCRADSPKKTAGASRSGRAGGGRLRKLIGSDHTGGETLVPYPHGTQTGTEEQDAEKAAITRKIRAHNEAQKKKRG